MKVYDLVHFIEGKTSSGATLDELKSHFDETDHEDLKRMVNAAVDMDMLKKDGKGRGLRYYGFNYEIVKITNIGSPYVNLDNKNLIDGAIDVSDCLTVKDKIRKVLASDHPLSRPITLTYREKLQDKESARIINFIRDGYRDVDVKITYEPLKKANVIYSKWEKVYNNTIWIGIEEGQYVIKLQVGGNPNQPEIMKFKEWAEFEKCVKNFAK